MMHAAIAASSKGDPVLVLWDRHERFPSRTPILGPDRALLALDPAADCKSINPAKYICSYPIKTAGMSILTMNVERTLAFPCFKVGSRRLPTSLPTEADQNSVA